MIETSFTRMFGCAYPLQMAGMGGYSTPALAIAVSKAGGLGMLSGIVRAADLASQLDGVPDDTIVAVNFLLPFLDPASVELAARRAALVEFFWGEPSSDLVDAARANGARVGWQVGSLGEAKAAVDVGCDVVVAQGVEAGGHVRGTTPLLALLEQIRPAIDVPLVAAGGIGTAPDVAAALGAGADAVRVGTRLLAATESVAHPDYIDTLIGAGADDTVITTAFGVGWPDAPHRVLKSCIEAGEARGADQAWTPNWPQVTDSGDVSAFALYAGTSVDAVHARQSAAEIVAELMGGGGPVVG